MYHFIKITLRFITSNSGWIHLQHTRVFRPKNNKKIPGGKFDSYTRMLQMNQPSVKE